MIESGDAAPQFELPNQNQEPVRLRSFTGQWVVLWFFPRVDTENLPYDDPWAKDRYLRDEPPKCTQQACAFRDSWEKFQGFDASVLGISTDPIVDQWMFARDFDLPFDLLSDRNGSVADMYQSFRTRTFEGTEYEVAFRNTFVIDDTGTVVHTYREVSNVEEHVQDVLDVIDSHR